MCSLKRQLWAIVFNVAPVLSSSFSRRRNPREKTFSIFSLLFLVIKLVNCRNLQLILFRPLSPSLGRLFSATYHEAPFLNERAGQSQQNREPVGCWEPPSEQLKPTSVSVFLQLDALLNVQPSKGECDHCWCFLWEREPFTNNEWQANGGFIWLFGCFVPIWNPLKRTSSNMDLSSSFLFFKLLNFWQQQQQSKWQ